jgi:hypothetical protein
MLPTALVSLPVETFPKLFIINGYLIVIGGFFLTLLEGVLLFKASVLKKKFT